MKKFLHLGVVAVSGWLLVAALLVPQTGVAQKHEFAVNENAERLPNLDRVKKQLREYRACTCTCGCFKKDFDSQAEKALLFLQKRAASRADGEKLAMVLDIDETSLDNWEMMNKSDFTYNSKAYTAWDLEARAPVLEGTLKLYKEARRLGVSVFFITGRPEEERAATEKNLLAQGYEGWQGLSLRGAHPHGESSATYKSAERAKIVAQGYTIVLNAGDQWSDLKGAPEAEYSVKYPNPYYVIP